MPQQLWQWKAKTLIIIVCSVNDQTFKICPKINKKKFNATKGQ
jgi:hypothetical protein